MWCIVWSYGSVMVVLDDGCSFSPLPYAFLQKYHHVVFGTTARLLVSINRGRVVCKGVQFETWLI